MTSRARAPNTGRFVIDARYVEPKPSGIGRYVEALVERLPRLDREAHFHLWTHPARPEPVSAPNVTSSPVPAPSDGLRTLLTPSRLGSLGVSDVLHLPFSILGRGLPCATVVTIHDLMWLEQPELVEGRPLMRRLRRPYYVRGMRWALERATRLIAVSEATRARMLTVAPECEARVSVTHNAADPRFVPAVDAIDAARVAAEIIGSPAPYFLVVGKNEPYKGHELAIAAFARAREADELLVLIQRASGGQRLLTLAAQLGVADRLRFLPAVSGEQLLALLQSASALLQPSIVEGFGIPAVEAMAVGCPVIGSDTPALVEVLGGAGLLAKVGDAAALAAAITQLREPGRGEELRARGLARASAFDWERTASATLEVYRAAREAFARSRRDRGAR
jgi:glycosyltransferase involved in cell wall biosynthesis